MAEDTEHEDREQEQGGLSLGRITLVMRAGPGVRRRLRAAFQKEAGLTSAFRTKASSSDFGKPLLRLFTQLFQHILLKQ